MTWADVMRAIVFGQSITIAMFSVVNVVLTIRLQHPRPGRLIALCSTTFSYLCALAFIIAHTLSRFGKEPTYFLPLGVVVVVTGTFGLSLLIAHLVFHTKTGENFVRSWFGPHDPH